MTKLEHLAEFVTGVQVDGPAAAAADCVRLHLFDTLVAGIAGGKIRDARAIAAVAEGNMASGEVPALGVPIKTSLSMAALVSCVDVRCTEIDDIHVASCTTPGSVIVPVGLAMAYREPRIEAKRFLAALLAGYEVMTRFGKAAGGPFILYKGVWPTYLSSTLGATATAARMIDLSLEQTAHALAAATTLTVGTSGRISGLSSRWLTLGCSVQNGLLAALAALQGCRGDLNLLEGSPTEVVGVKVDVGKLISNLGAEFETRRVSIKPYCAAKQATSAIYGFLQLLDREHLDPLDIERVVVKVPKYYSAMINRPETPADRIDSIVSVQYQLALAAHHSDQLADIHRYPIHQEPEFRDFMDRVTVEVDESLHRYFPEAWPARVEVQTKNGRSAQQVQYAKGDSPDPYTWEEVIHKAGRVLGVVDTQPGVERLASVCRDLGQTTTVDDLLTALGEVTARE